MTTIGKKRRHELLWKIPLTAAILIAAFWGIWFLFSGSVPVVTGIKLTWKKTLVLPFAISRWWDVLFGVVWTFFITLLTTSEKLNEKHNLTELGDGRALGVIACLPVGWLAAYGSGQVGPCLGFMLLYGAFIFLVAGPLVDLVVSLVAGLIIGLIAGLSVGLFTSLITGLSIVLGALIIIIASIVRPIVQRWLFAN